MHPLRAWLAGVVVAVAATMGPRVAAAASAVPGGATRPPLPVSFLSHDAGWIAFYYPPSARERVGSLIAQADDARAALGRVLGPPLLDGVQILVARGPDEMAAFAPQPASGSPPAAAAVPEAVSSADLKIIVLSLGEFGTVESGELGESFRRQLARVALNLAVRGRADPGWLTEGFSTDFAGARSWSRQWLLFEASATKGIAPLAALDPLILSGGPSSALARAEGADFVRFLLRPEKSARFAVCAERMREGEPFAAAIASSYRQPLADLEAAWRRDLGTRCLVRGAAAAAALPAALLVGIVAIRWARRRRSRGGANDVVAGATASSRRVHIVMTRREESTPPPIIPDAEVPRVEHEGEWHTLH